MLRKIKRFNLIKVIYDDLCIYGKLQLLLLLLVLISSMLVILVTYHTRYMIINREKLLFEKVALDAEWRSLMLEEKILSNRNRIEYIATHKLKMHYIDPVLDSVFLVDM